LNAAAATCLENASSASRSRSTRSAASPTGETVVDPTIVVGLFARKRHTDPLGQLTGREPEMLALAAEGLSNQAIATGLFVTERTVEAHVNQIFLKLGLNTDPGSHRPALAVLAYLHTPRQSPRRCALTGYPKVDLYMAAGHRLAFSYTDGHSMYFTSHRPGRVVLARARQPSSRSRSTAATSGSAQPPP
jgi:DNA-binding CsgD family transcriptional regulator